jgi:hypothetical protein
MTTPSMLTEEISLSEGFSGAMPGILRACLGCGRSNFTSAKGAPHRIRGTRPDLDAAMAVFRRCWDSLAS